MRWSTRLLAFSLLVTGCASVQQSGQPSTPSGPSTPLSCPAKAWCDQYQTFLRAQLTTSPQGRALLGVSQSSLCKTKVEPVTFALALFKSIAFAESGYDPSSGMTEDFQDGKTHEAARSVGLMQLSVGDSLNYKTPYCQKLTAATLKDPEVNLGCSIEIMGTLASRYGVLVGYDADRGWLGIARYWSTIRPGHPAVARLKTELPGCF